MEEQFLIFAGMTFYPSGGWEDFQGYEASLEDAITAVANLDSIEWWHIVHMGRHESKIVKEGERS